MTDHSSADDADPDEADLRALRAVAAGNGDAFEPLVHRHQERLHRLCTRMLGNREEAAEATQEVFLKAFRKAAGFRPRARVSTWLYRIATNHCLNRLRRRRIVRFLGFGDLAPPGDERRELDPPDAAPDAERRLAGRRRWRRLRDAIERLSPGQRSVLVLVRFEGESYRRTAEILGITVSAVESRLFRAMRRLEAVLDDEERNENER